MSFAGSGIAEACAAHGVSPDVLGASEEVILFGSVAAGTDGPGSDVDLLCVGEGRFIRSRALDLLWLHPREVHAPAWLGSELAAHVARHGVWLQGTGRWRGEVRISGKAVDDKRRAIAEHAIALAHSWERLLPPYRARHVARLRQDLQRLEYLINDEGCPSTPRLDELWRATADAAARLRQLVRHAGGDARRALNKLVRDAGSNSSSWTEQSTHLPGG